jgi:hypothetical protein
MSILFLLSRLLLYLFSLKDCISLFLPRRDTILYSILRLLLKMTCHLTTGRVNASFGRKTRTKSEENAVA